MFQRYLAPIGWSFWFPGAGGVFWSGGGGGASRRQGVGEKEAGEQVPFLKGGEGERYAEEQVGGRQTSRTPSQGNVIRHLTARLSVRV